MYRYIYIYILPGASDGHCEVVPDGAALDEVLVDLGLVEAADDGPDCGGRRVDPLGEQGGALPWVQPVGVQLPHDGNQLVELRLSQTCWQRRYVGRGGGCAGCRIFFRFLRALAPRHQLTKKGGEERESERLNIFEGNLFE